MFCPNCKAEYRDGFTSCADCRVDLAPERPKGSRRDLEDPEQSPSKYFLAWFLPMMGYAVLYSLALTFP
jgi:hypothetical protein